MTCFKIFIAFWTVLDNRIGTESTRERLQCFDLQLFNGEKTEDATPKKKSDARKKGQVAKSTEINSAFGILVAFFTLDMMGSYIYQQLSDYMRFTYLAFSLEDFNINIVRQLFFDFGIVLFKIVLPVMAAVLTTSLALNFFQVGFHISFETILPKLDKLNPLSGFKRIFSKRTVVELFKSLFKVSIICYFVFRFLAAETGRIPELVGLEISHAVSIAVSMILDLVFQISGVMVILAVVDFCYQRWEHAQSLKMSKQEVKDEYKQTEGNPQIKGKIKERQRAMAMRRMMQDVPGADVVVTNPTHFAVALKYDNTMAAPAIVAKGQDLIAKRIKDIAAEHKVTIVENKPLARALFWGTEVGDVVPPELYKSVAEVLAYVYRLKKQSS